MFDPRREVVSFVGREEELNILVAWCHEDDASRLRLVTGPGGVGKTRLAVELCDRMRRAGWKTERIADGKEAHAISALRDVSGSRALLVVDYAETRAGLGQLVSDLVGSKGKGVRSSCSLVLLGIGGIAWASMTQQSGSFCKPPGCW